jgi:hypothetical protein
MAETNGKIYRIRKSVVENLKSDPFSIFNELKRQGMNLKSGGYECDVIDPTDPDYYLCHVIGDEIINVGVASIGKAGFNLN